MKVKNLFILILFFSLTLLSKSYAQGNGPNDPNPPNGHVVCFHNTTNCTLFVNIEAGIEVAGTASATIPPGGEWCVIVGNSSKTHFSVMYLCENARLDFLFDPNNPYDMGSQMYLDGEGNPKALCWRIEGTEIYIEECD